MLKFEAQPQTAAQVSYLVSFYRPTKVAELFHNFKDKLSMLHADVLTLLYHFGAHSSGNILELGPFIGGSTIALAWGTRDANRACQFVTVEMGGSFSHPTMGASDVVAELRKNLSSHESAERVSVVVGNSRDNAVVSQVKRTLPEKSVGLLVIDSDGLVETDFDIYAPLLSAGAYIIVDDYFCPGNIEKGNYTKHGLDSLEDRGVVETLGVYGWGTWVGRLK
jgi:predicted O-methyltransferase YrrM